MLLLAACVGLGVYVGLIRGELERTKQALEHAHETVFEVHQTVQAQGVNIARAHEENAALATEVSRLKHVVRKNKKAARFMRENDCRANDPLCGIPLDALDGTP